MHKFLLSAFLLVSPAICFADCTVAEVVKMVKNGSGRNAIEKACDSEVGDAPRCRWSKMLQFAQSTKSESGVNDHCGACDSPRCDVGMRWCGLTKPQVGTSVEGDDCYCNTPMGPAQGTLSCNN